MRKVRRSKRCINNKKEISVRKSARSHSTHSADITWIVEGHQSKVIQRSLRSAQGCFQDLGRALDDLDQVVVHGAGHIEDERQGGCALRDVFLRGPGP